MRGGSRPRFRVVKSTFETIGEIVDGIVSAMNYFTESTKAVSGIMLGATQGPNVGPDEQEVIDLMTGASSGKALAPVESAPSLFDRAAGFFGFGGGDEAGGDGGSGKGRAAVTVDFRGMPRGARVETRADSGTDLEVTTGYAMQGAQ